MRCKYTKDWKMFASEEPVAGVTQENREVNFLLMGDQPDFKIFLEREPGNPVDLNAIKVIGSATVDGEPMTEQLGYLPKETAQKLQDEEELDAKPKSVYLPQGDRNYGLKIMVLVRSKGYKKKIAKKGADAQNPTGAGGS
jgi:hypothetical protein